MNDKQLAALIMSQLLPAMQATAGLEDVKLAKNFQNRQQGASTSPYVYFVKLTDKRYGSPKRKDTLDVGGATFTHTETQQMESPYQFSAWVPQNPKDIAGLTESDVLNMVCGIIQSDAILSAFRAQGVEILRVTDVRNPYIVDDRDQFEAVPSFDVIFAHKRTTVSTIPAVITYEANFGRV